MMIIERLGHSACAGSSRGVHAVRISGAACVGGQATACKPNAACYECIEKHIAAVHSAGCAEMDLYSFCSAAQPWKCAHPQPDGSCVNSDPTKAQWDFAQRAIPQGPACKDCPSEQRPLPSPCRSLPAALRR